MPNKSAITIKKALIDNRGEIALRILRTCHELGIGAVVGYSSRDADSFAVREALRLGQESDLYGAALLGGDTAAESYEDFHGVIAAAKAIGCDAIHPGYGFLSERADAAAAIAAAGLIFIGPEAEVIERVGNKSQARALAVEKDAPVMPASPLLHRYAEVVTSAETIGYPVVLKADIGGGGMNNLFVETAAQLKDTFENFSLRNPGGFYVEKKLDHARHIELQLAADVHGNVLVLGERDCTAQRKAQKVIEEAPVLVAPEVELAFMRDDAIRMAKAVRYTGVGTWEFLYDPLTHKHYFMEINPRIQVEHTVTEALYDGLDIVAWQLLIASGAALPELPARRTVHAIQLRLYAEEPYYDFRPSPGILSRLHLPKPNSAVRIDRGYEQGDELPAGFDATIAKLIITADDREAARNLALRAINETLVSGVATNRDFLRWLLDTDEFKDDSHWTTFIEPAWRAAQHERFTDVERFFGNGTFEGHAKPASFDAQAYVQDMTYTRRGVRRNYSRDLAKAHQAHPNSCGFRYGIYTDQSCQRLAVGYWDFSVMGGTLGSEEGAAVEALFKLAHAEGLPVVTITASSGARQQEGAKALQMMDVMVAARWAYKPPLYINVYAGLNFGGVTVSLAESADISIAVTGGKIGFAGPDLVARMMGKKSGRELEVGAHSAEDAVGNRTVDVLCENLSAAREQVMALVGQLEGSHANESLTAKPESFQAIVPRPRYDRPSTERFITTIAPLWDGSTLRRNPAPAANEPPQTITQTRALLSSADRPTVADYLNPELRLFDSVAALSVREMKQDAEEYAPIIGALAKIDGQSVMVLGQQTQRRLRDDGTFEKVYVAPRARDFRWAKQKVELAQSLGLPILLLCDTTGGDASLNEEADGVSRSIANFIGMFYEPGRITVPVISVVIGENGSGGGLTFGRKLDASADLQYALTFVATPDAQVKILTDVWPAGALDTAVIVDQLRDATANGRKQLGQIDAIIAEPVGGAQADPVAAAKNIRAFVTRSLTELSTIAKDELIKRRIDRIQAAGRYGLSPDSHQQL